MYDVDYNSLHYVGHVITVIKRSPVDGHSLPLCFYGVIHLSPILTMGENFQDFEADFPQKDSHKILNSGISYQENRYNAYQCISLSF